MRLASLSLRYKILDFLYKVYPEAVEELTIIHVFYEYHTVDDIKKHLNYLVDKGYIEQKEICLRLGTKKTTNIYKITSKGIDLMQGIIQDKAIPIPGDE